MAVTFYPHPNVVLGRTVAQTTLSPLRVKARVLAEHGIEHLVLLHFTKTLARMRAKDFIRAVLWEQLGIQHLVIGPDAHVGVKREGTPDVIVSEFLGAGRTAEVLPFVEVGRERVSSREVRAALEEGVVERAQQLLGRPYEISGRVVRGDGRGKGIGFPTANIAYGRAQLPRFGVYGGLVVVDGTTSHRAVCNIGIRPTFQGQRPAVEAFLPDFQGEDFYGQRVSLKLLSRIRDERRFSGVEELKAQIASDVAEVCRRIPTPPE
jgi:riboflavin kinase/FMN adenylyltransferase